MSVITADLLEHWAHIRPWLTLRHERDYAAAVARLDELLDVVGDNPRHPLYGLMDTLGALIEAYEEAHHPMPEVTGAEALRYLMDEHGLTQAEMPEIGSQGVVSEILRGKRELNVRQIRALAARFGVSPAVFITPLSGPLSRPPQPARAR